MTTSRPAKNGIVLEAQHNPNSSLVVCDPYRQVLLEIQTGSSTASSLPSVEHSSSESSPASDCGSSSFEASFQVRKRLPVGSTNSFLPWASSTLPPKSAQRLMSSADNGMSARLLEISARAASYVNALLCSAPRFEFGYAAGSCFNSMSRALACTLNLKAQSRNHTFCPNAPEKPHSSCRLQSRITGRHWGRHAVLKPRGPFVLILTDYTTSHRLQDSEPLSLRYA